MMWEKEYVYKNELANRMGKKFVYRNELASGMGKG
jgi:hypothetical protein